MAKIGTNGKGDVLYKNGITLNEYARVHKWLIYNYGSANKCTNKLCLDESTKYQYALKKGCNYEKNIDSFIQLCTQCHKKYDLTDEFIEKCKSRVQTEETKSKLSSINLGRKLSNESKKKISDRMKGSNNPMFGVSIKGENHHFFGKSHTVETKLKLSELRGFLNKEQVVEIRNLSKLGVKQVDIAKMFSISKTSVNKILKNKTYTQW